jgi:selenocysteine lyase/cysteine desulfurase
MSSFWKAIREDFPITKHAVYLDHASGGPIPRPVFEKIKTYYETHLTRADFAWGEWIRQREAVRKKAADFIHANPSEITFIQSTSQGMNLIAEMLWREGAVLTNTSEFPSSTLPWIWRRAKMIFQKAEMGEISPLKLKILLSPSVKTIVTSFVQYATGFRQDLETLGKIKGNRFLVVNATQGFGAFPIDVEKSRIDFLCTNSYKWLMAGYGGGVLYIRKKWLPRFQPSSVGWRSMKEPERMDNRRVDIKNDASRYEMGCPSFPTIFGVGAAIDYLSSIGMEKIQTRILELTDFAIRGLEKKGYEVISPRRKENRSGIVVFKVKNPDRVWKSLLAKRIYVSPRGEGIRVAPHFYNTFEEIETFLKQC